MNKYFDRNDVFNSNSRTYEGCFTEAKAENHIWNFLLAALQIFSGHAFLQKIRVALVALSLIGFIGIIGAMEAGSLGTGTGLLIGALLLSVEYLCLKGRHRA